MADRIQLRTKVYMPLDGIWQIVLGGSVIDVPDAAAFHATHATILRNETSQTLRNNKPAPVRNVRRG